MNKAGSDYHHKQLGKLVKYQYFYKLFLVFLILQLTNLTSLALTTKIVTEKVTKSTDNSAKSSVNTSILQLPGDTVVVQHFPGLNGHVDGSIRVLLGESGNVLSGTVVSGDLLVPGTPSLNINSATTYNGTVVGTGNSSPTGYTLNINNNVSLRHVVTKTDPISLPPALGPYKPGGKASLSLNSGQTVSDFLIVQNITLNPNYGQLVVPQGNYGDFIAISNAGFTFGVNGQNTTYNLRGLDLRDSTQLQIRGNVTINISDTFNTGASSTIGDSNNPIGLFLKTNATNLILNTNTKIYGVVQAPLANVTIRAGALLKGSLVCDKLTLSGLIQNLVADVSSPSVLIDQPTENQVISSSTTIVSGTFQDSSLVSSVSVNGVIATINGNNYTATVPLNNGSNTLTVTATDIFGNVGTAIVNVMRNVVGNLAPVVNAGSDASVTLPTNNLTLNGTVTDDGLPNPPAQTTILWSKVSSPTGGTVTFSNPSSASTNASFNIAGTYTLKLEASDSISTASDTVIITVNQAQQQNQAPVVNAGNDQTVSSSVTLNGTVVDDGLPQGATLSISWTKVSGSGTVTFSSPSTALTTASFSQAGTYTLRLTASDTALTTSDDVTVIVNPSQPNNVAPQVNAGQDKVITLPNSATLQGQVSDDGNPNPPAQLSLSWTKVDGNGTVSFSSPNTAITQATFSVAGTYTLRLTANDGALSTSDDVIITVNGTTNQPPIVSAGNNQSSFIPGRATLQGTVSDDGLPTNSTITVIWSKVSGNGTVSFTSGNELNTFASFSEPGVYLLRLSATDGLLTSSSDITITVEKQQLLVIYSGLTGLEPRVVKVVVKPIFISLLNRTGLENLTYRLRDKNQQILQTFTMPMAGEMFVEYVFSSTDNEIFITEDNNPSWSCHITTLP